MTPDPASSQPGRHRPGLALAATLAAIVLTACDTGNEAPVVVGTLERDRIDLGIEADEPIIAVAVQEGDTVTAGAVLLRQDPRRRAAALAAAEAQRDAVRAALDEARNGPRAEQVRQAEQRLAGARAALDTATADLARERGLAKVDYSSRSRIDQLEGQVEQAAARLNEHRAVLDELQAGTRSETLARLAAELAALDDAVTGHAIALEQLTVRAPVDGVVESVRFEPGERPPRGAAAITLLGSGRTWARVHIPATLRPALAVGAPAEVSIDGDPAPHPARLHWVAADAAFTPYYALTQHDRSRLAWLAEVDLDDGAGLPVGLPVEVRFTGLAP